jgi:hypothetical protein
MKITLDLPEFDASDASVTGRDPETGAPEGFDDCALCGEELSGTAVKLLPYGWLHAEKCLQAAVDRTQGAYSTAWLTVAQHVAKYPSRHSATTIRAVLQNVTRIAGRAAR